MSAIMKNRQSKTLSTTAEKGKGQQVSAARVVIVIPAYKPPPGLPKLVADLTGDSRVEAAVVVDDGSGPDFQSIFQEIQQNRKAIVLRHAANQGKGAALKTGLDYAARTYPNCSGVITADADGQHTPDDIWRVTAAFLRDREALILGARQFDTAVPVRSRVGNTITRWVFRVVAGQMLRDTQTGLRAVPRSFIPDLLRSKATGYDFELDMLIVSCRKGWRVAEVPISTIYLDGNRSSHFSPLWDSMKIYFVFLRYSAASLLTAGVDNLIFILAYLPTHSVVAAMCSGRLVAGLFNYFANKRATFHSQVPDRNAMPKFCVLLTCSGLASYGIITQLVSRTGISVLVAKVTAETILFFVNFWVQRTIVFQAPQKEARTNGDENVGKAAPVQ